MHYPTSGRPNPKIGLQSSLAEISEKLSRSGVLANADSPVENMVFRTYVLEPHIARIDQVHQLLRQLDVDSKMSGHKGRCAKVQSAQAWMAQEHGGAPDLTWAIMGLALARHKVCDCHETGSLQAVRHRRRGGRGVRPSLLELLAYYLRQR